LFASSDPSSYVRFGFTDKKGEWTKQVHKTKMKKKTLSPKWTENDKNSVLWRIADVCFLQTTLLIASSKEMVSTSVLMSLIGTLHLQMISWELTK
jgi:Ca2+-dependent lipid-binding protein